MIINNAINSPLPTALAEGGTGASLMGSAGGIFYSGPTTAAILDGTPTRSQMLLSGSPTPSWSTATYPIGTNPNDILYSSSANVVSGLTAIPSSCLITNATQAPLWQTLGDGQIIIGSSSGVPSAATITAGTNVTITNAPGSITINSIPSAIGNWQWIATQTASSSLSLHFDNNFNASYSAYRLVLVNLLLTGVTPQLYLQLGTAGPVYISSGYIYQLADIANNGAGVDYPGSDGLSFGQVLLTYADNNGASTDPTYGGISGYIDLYVTAGSSLVGNGISYLSYMSYMNTSNYTSTTCTFQQPAANFTSVQLFAAHGYMISSGSAYLYGITR